MIYIKRNLLFFLCAVTIFLASYSPTTAQRLDLFTSLGSQGSITGDVTPYPAVSAIYDYISEAEQPDTVIEGQPWYFVYFQLPFEVNEIGVRMLVPVPDYVFAEAGNVVTEAFENNKQRTKYFNPFIVLEKRVQDTVDVTKFYWEEVAKNDDSESVIAQPDGKFGNSLIQITGMFEAGTYRVKFRGENKKVVEGTYLMQFGFLPKVRRLNISRGF